MANGRSRYRMFPGLVSAAENRSVLKPAIIMENAYRDYYMITVISCSDYILTD